MDSNTLKTSVASWSPMIQISKIAGAVSGIHKKTLSLVNILSIYTVLDFHLPIFFMVSTKTPNLSKSQLLPILKL